MQTLLLKQQHLVRINIQNDRYKHHMTDSIIHKMTARSWSSIRTTAGTRRALLSSNRRCVQKCRMNQKIDLFVRCFVLQLSSLV